MVLVDPELGWGEKEALGQIMRLARAIGTRQDGAWIEIDGEAHEGGLVAETG